MLQMRMFLFICLIAMAGTAAWAQEDIRHTEFSDALESSPVSDEERAKIGAQMQRFASGLQTMQMLPKFDGAIVLPDPAEGVEEASETRLNNSNTENKESL